MDDFTVYGNTFDEAVNNLRKVLKICQETNLSLIHEKRHVLLTKRIFLGHHISPSGIQVDPTKFKVITKHPIPMNQNNVYSFLSHVGYYRRFIENITKIT
jgi:hypothetical protein